MPNSRFKIKVKSVPVDESLVSKNGWMKMRLQWLISEKTSGAKKGVLGHTIFLPGGSHRAHMHMNAEEYIVIVKGQGVQRVGRGTFPVRPGDVVYVPRATIHSTRNSSNTRNLELFFVYSGAPSLAKSGYRPVKQ